MKKKNFMLTLIIFWTITLSYFQITPVIAQVLWRVDQLMPPSDLSDIINSPSTHKPIVFSIGVMAMIKGSIDIGPVSQKSNLDKFRNELSKLPKNTDIVIYCGCCPFENCPNIRPAFKLLKDLGFTNHKLLNLQTNIKVDWMNKGYPVQ